MSYYEIRPINRFCGSYGPGHLLHWIQGKKSHEDGQPIINVKVVAVHDDGFVEVEGHELKLRLWYHDPVITSLEANPPGQDTDII